MLVQLPIALSAALIYVLAVIFLKRALQEGAGSWRVTFICNMVAVIGYQACWLVRTQPFSAIGAMHAAMAACAFFAGQIFTFLALNRGDVSVVTPILGTKVIWLAFLSVLLAGRQLPQHIWIAAFVTALGTAIIGFQPGARPSHVVSSIGLALATTGSFALGEIFILKYSSAWGFGSFVPTMFIFVGILSLGLIPFMRGKSWAPATLGLGAVLLAIQSLAMIFAIWKYGRPTQLNIAYNSRGLWTVLVIWFCGPLLGNTERDRGSRIMLLRLAGAALLVIAIFIASL